MENETKNDDRFVASAAAAAAAVSLTTRKLVALTTANMTIYGDGGADYSKPMNKAWI